MIQETEIRGWIMENRVTVCPKCGYRHDASGTIPETECPKCGIIYEKYYARQKTMEQATAGVSDPGTAPVPPVKKPFPVRLVAVAALILLISGLAVWKFTGGKHGAAATASLSSEKVIKSFPYDIRGTYGARFTSEFNGGQAGPAYAYTSDYEATVTINDRYRVSRLSWTDYHVTLARTKVSWETPSVAEIACEERSGGTPEKNREPFSQILTLRRLGSALALDFHRPGVGEVVFDLKNAVKEPLPGEEANGLFQYIKEQDALRAPVKVTVVPRGVIDVPRDTVSTFTGSSFWGHTCFETYKHKGGSGLLPRDGGYLRNGDCEKLGIFAAGSAGVSILLNLTKVDVQFGPMARTSGPNTQLPEPNPIQLTPDSRFQFDFNVYERDAEVLFFRDGKKKLRIKDRKVAEKPLEFDLEKQ
jgi:hypothetical protein